MPRLLHAHYSHLVMSVYFYDSGAPGMRSENTPESFHEF